MNFSSFVHLTDTWTWRSLSWEGYDPRGENIAGIIIDPYVYHNIIMDTYRPCWIVQIRLVSSDRYQYCQLPTESRKCATRYWQIQYAIPLHGFIRELDNLSVIGVRWRRCLNSFAEPCIDVHTRSEFRACTLQPIESHWTCCLLFVSLVQYSLSSITGNCVFGWLLKFVDMVEHFDTKTLTLTPSNDAQSRKPECTTNTNRWLRYYYL